MFLTENKITFRQQYGKKDDYFYLNGQTLDFYLPEYKIAIECQGEQHFRPVDFGNKGKEYSVNCFRKIILRDFKKYSKCKEFGLKIIYYCNKININNEYIDDQFYKLDDILKKLKIMSNLKHKNLYGILKIDKDSSDKEIKKSYYKLSKQYHPDLNRESESDSIFKDICEAYKILIDEETRADYDLKSKFGNNYNEYYELFEIKVDLDYDAEKNRYETFKKNDVYNIQIKVDDTFNGTVEYERWVKCKPCDGSGKDFSSKIIIKDANGNITKTFDADDGCDFCDGTGKDYKGQDCHFCSGKGKIGLTPCKNCKGEKRILGKQKLTGIKLSGKETKIDAMGHFAKNEPGKVGYLMITK